MKTHLTSIARILRRKPTDAEKTLWSHIKYKQLMGFKFRRQQPLGSFILDFVCFERKLAIELDGGQHALEKEKDEERDLWLQKQGFKVLRFWNTDVLQNLEGVLETIEKALLSPSP